MKCVPARPFAAAVAGYLMCFIGSGCAHYYWPANQLESPEAIGPERIGRLELVGIQAGSDLIDSASRQPTDPETGETPDSVF